MSFESLWAPLWEGIKSSLALVSKLAVDHVEIAFTIVTLVIGILVYNWRSWQEH